VHLCGYDEVAIKEFIKRLEEEERFMEEELESFNEDEDEVDETMNLEDQVDVMDLYSQQATI
jgi:hypothetical protein